MQLNNVPTTSVALFKHALENYRTIEDVDEDINTMIATALKELSTAYFVSDMKNNSTENEVTAQKFVREAIATFKVLYEKDPQRHMNDFAMCHYNHSEQIGYYTEKKGGFTIDEIGALRPLFEIFNECTINSDNIEIIRLNLAGLQRCATLFSINYFDRPELAYKHLESALGICEAIEGVNELVVDRYDVMCAYLCYLGEQKEYEKAVEFTAKLVEVITYIIDLDKAEQFNAWRNFITLTNRLADDIKANTLREEFDSTMIKALLSVIEVFKNRKLLLCRQDFVPWGMRNKDVNKEKAADFCSHFSSILFSAYSTLLIYLDALYCESIVKDLLAEAISFYKLILNVDGDRQTLLSPGDSYCGELLHSELKKLEAKTVQSHQEKSEGGGKRKATISLRDLRRMMGMKNMELKDYPFYIQNKDS